MPQTGGATSPCPICGLFFHPEALAAHADSCASRAYGDGVYTTRHSANRRPARSPDALSLCVRALSPSPSPRPRSARSTDEIAIRSFPIPLPLSHAVESNPRRSGTPPPSPTRTPSMRRRTRVSDGVARRARAGRLSGMSVAQGGQRARDGCDRRRRPAHPGLQTPALELRPRPAARGRPRGDGARGILRGVGRAAPGAEADPRARRPRRRRRRTRAEEAGGRRRRRGPPRRLARRRAPAGAEPRDVRDEP